MVDPSRDVRPATASDLPFLKAMLREAAAGPPVRPRQPLSEVLAVPQTARYVEHWGRPGDRGRIAHLNPHAPVGAAWYRLFTAARPGYGFVAADVPELAVGVSDDARGKGVGTALLTALVEDAISEGHLALSLSVALDNLALRLYERLGFVAVDDDGTHQTMCLQI